MHEQTVGKLLQQGQEQNVTEWAANELEAVPIFKYGLQYWLLALLRLHRQDKM